MGTASGSEDSNGSSTAEIGLTVVLTLGEEAGKIIITGTESVPIVIAGTVGFGIIGLQEWSRPKNYHPPTNVPTGDISIGVPKPHIPTGLLWSTSDGGRLAQDIISKERKGSINKEFPDQYRNQTLDQIEKTAKAGEAAAKKALKLLRYGRFKK